MMYSVYKSALLNISADDSNDARWGCFRNRDPFAVFPMRLRLSGDAGPSHQNLLQDQGASASPPSGQKEVGGGEYWLTPDSTGLFEAITKAPLAKRAWVFQERQLSRRVLHFTSREVVWECCAEGPYFACETFPRGAPLSTLFGGRPKYQGQGQGLTGGGKGDGGGSSSSPEEEQRAYDTWDMLCQSYSEKKLSHVGDKTVALSGLAREFQALLPRDEYVAGMWRSLLPQGLLWKSADSSGRIESDGYVAPSWSWLSIDGPIKGFAPRGTSLSAVEVLNITTEPVIPTEPTASLRGAYIDLRCYLRPVEIKPDHEAKPWYMLAVGGGKNHKLAIGDGGMEVGSFDNPGYRDIHRDTFTYSFDVPFTENSGPQSVSAYFLPVSVDGPDETSSTSINGLLVEPVDDHLTIFRRVGVMSCSGLHCLPALYRARGVSKTDQGSTEFTGLWEKLQSLLGESYMKRESIKREPRHQEIAEDSSSAPLEDESPLPGSTINEAEEKQDVPSTVSVDAAKTSSDANEVETENKVERANTSAGADVDKLGEEMEDLNVTGTDGKLEPPVPRVNLEAFEALERLYASDGAFVGSELEQHFERMVTREIRLI
jgi:hypothetical protein